MTSPLIPAATLVLLVDSRDGIKTLLLQRQKSASFLPGAWVFPGGIVEAQDEQGDAWHTAAYAASRECLEEAGLAIAPSELTPFAHWIAPVEAGKRFDTRFFLAKLTQEKEVELQVSEIYASQWLSPREAIDRHHQQQLTIIPPTLISLELLSRFDRVDQAIAHYSALPPTTFAPKICFWQDQTFMLYQGDCAYDSLDMSKKGTRNRCQLKANGWHYLHDS